jgi:hypothetical protein
VIQPNNVYDEVVPIGEYPLPNRLAWKEEAKHYIPKIADVTFGVLN